MMEEKTYIPFWKMHGAGNDFILVDDRAGAFPCGDSDWIARIAARRTGVGCEGVILIQPSDTAHFRMRFFNPDGGEVDMCGNGARCVARLAYELDVAPAEMTIETRAGTLSARVMGEAIRLTLSKPTGLTLNRSIVVDGVPLVYGFVNTGVPHVVVEVDDVAEVNVPKTGSGLRYHEVFAPAGTNANFYQVADGHTILVRTYERGVEGETLACGTGITACALVAACNRRVLPPVNVVAASRDVLTVDFKASDDVLEDVTLLGPAVHVFRGTVPYVPSSKG